MRNNHTRRLCIAGVVGALYAVLTLTLPMLSFSTVQVRFSEALTVLPFLFPETIPGLAVGCFITNLIGSPFAPDWVFGTLATLLAALWTSRLKHKALAPLPPVICNLVIIGAVIAWCEVGFTSAFPALWAWNAFTVGLGELIACGLLGTLLLRVLPKIPYFREMIPQDRLELMQ